MVNWASFFKRIPIEIQLSRKGKYSIAWRRPDPSLDHVGITHVDIKQIILSLDLKPRMAVHTYIHEIIHAVDEEYKVGLTEKQVLALEKAVYFILKPGNIFKEK